MRWIARIVVAAAFAAAAAQAIRWLLERDADVALDLPSPETAPVGAASRNGTAPAGSRGSDGPTRDELYAEARHLDIQGRSKMKKQELQQAVEAAKTGGAA